VGYVLDFGNASFAAFLETCLDFDPYEGSKAATLRKIWFSEPTAQVLRAALADLKDLTVTRAPNAAAFTRAE
jgi:hypothetical protein